MLLRINEERLGDTTVVHVAGRLVGAGVEELSRSCRTAIGPVRVELSGLLEADEVGLSLLRSLAESGVELAGVSPFIQLLLNSGKNNVVH
ncbi:MAG TPA: hypothetical protein VK416_10725 [Thermoanaerobaculia bacterium]|nr:hypothetical protein [Thermoanaerobaculia bacterium]